MNNIIVHGCIVITLILSKATFFIKKLLATKLTLFIEIKKLLAILFVEFFYNSQDVIVTGRTNNIYKIVYIYVKFLNF